MMNLTAKQKAFLNIHKANPSLSIAQLVYVVNHGSLEGYDKIPMRQLQTYSQNGSRMKKTLEKMGVVIHTKPSKTARPDKLLARELKKLSEQVDTHGDKINKEKLIERFVDKVNFIVDTSKFKTEDKMNKVEKEAFTDNSLMLCDMIDLGQLKNATTKEEQIKILTAMVHYSTSIERNIYGTEETGYTSKSYMRHPQVAFQCIKLICELTGTLQQQTTNINIQVNNILQEIEQKRLKELTEDFNDILK
jgi:hypothetical protein